MIAAGPIRAPVPGHRRRLANRIAAVAVGTLLAGTNSLSGIESCIVPEALAASRPDPQGPPVEVQVGLYVIDVIEIDDLAQSFTADLHLAVSWQDARLGAPQRETPPRDCEVALTSVWHPYVGILNQREVRRLLPESVVIETGGRLLYRQRAIAELTAPLDLRAFPFDRQVLPVRVASVRYDDRDVVLRVDEERSGQLEALSLTGWTTTMAAAIETDEGIGPNRKIDRIDFRIAAKRQTPFYIWKAFLPLGLIVFMAWTVFWIDPSQFGPQIGIPTSAIITLIAFQFRLGQMLPRVSYLTRADQLILGSSVLVFLALGEAVLTSRLMHLGRRELALRIDRWSRILFAVAFLILTAAIFR